MARPRTVFLSIAFLLLVAFLCGAQSTTRKHSTTPQPARAALLLSESVTKRIEEQLIKREKDLAAAEQRRAIAVVEEALAEDFHEIGIDDRLYTKADVVPMLPDVKIEDYSLTDFKVVPLNKESAVVTYIANVQGSYKGEAFPKKNCVSSVWARRNGSWRLVFHQATPVPESK
ncbi:MAG TPA: nuclear transport factor 2 family protein [Terriglobales bacterium]|nr:nuclear transport factor 2 family protein [Terriglobales bacterium]